MPETFLAESFHTAVIWETFTRLYGVTSMRCRFLGEFMLRFKGIDYKL
jgi:hypothetical protein